MYMRIQYIMHYVIYRYVYTRPFQERHSITRARAHTGAKVYNSVINRIRKSNF